MITFVLSRITYFTSSQFNKRQEEMTTFDTKIFTFDIWCKFFLAWTKINVSLNNQVCNLDSNSSVGSGSWVDSDSWVGSVGLNSWDSWVGSGNVVATAEVVIEVQGPAEHIEPLLQPWPRSVGAASDEARDVLQCLHFRLQCSVESAFPVGGSRAKHQKLEGWSFQPRLQKTRQFRVLHSFHLKGLQNWCGNLLRWYKLPNVLRWVFPVLNLIKLIRGQNTPKLKRPLWG